MRRVVRYFGHDAKPFWRGQAIALVCVAIAIGVRAAMSSFTNLYFVTLAPLIVAAGLWGGVWSSVTTSVLGGLIVAYVWIPPQYSLALSPQGWVQVGIFLLSAVIMIGMVALNQAALEALTVAEQRAATVSGELRHRLANTLAVIQSVARQSYTSASPEEHDVFSGRATALVKAQLLLKDDPVTFVPMRVLLDTILLPFQTGQFVLEPKISHAQVPGDLAVGLALIFHELATNSLKYGALSLPAGRVHIDFAVTPDDAKIVWDERNGPPVNKPSSDGFGSKLLQRALPSDRGSVSIGFPSEGLRCEVICMGDLAEWLPSSVRHLSISQAQTAAGTPLAI